MSTTAAGAPPPGPRFLQLVDVAEILNTSSAQVYALVRRGDLKAIKIGGRGQWRVEAPELENYIGRMYADAQRFVDEHPFVEAETMTETMTEAKTEPTGEMDKNQPQRP